MSKFLKIAGLSFVFAFGAFMFVYGEKDDSPGAQGIGVILAAGAVLMIAKIARK